MNRYPEFIEINGKRYKINTDFRLALKCDEIVRDETIGAYETSLAIIYILLGENGLNDHENHEKMIELLVKYLKCGKNFDEETEEIEEPSMNFKQDEGYIKASFMSDYNIDLNDTEMHWWKFNDLMQGLTEYSVLNRVRAIREEPLSGKKGKELDKWIKLKKQVELKHEKTSREKELDEFWRSQFEKR